MKRILVTGAGGQLGMALRQIIESREDLHGLFTDYQQIDITNSESVEQAVSVFKPDYIINAAAYTAVDKAESEPQICRTLNATALSHLATAAKKHGARLIHISTDYVYGGDATRPYRESDPTHPCNVYGRTKLEGEQIVAQTLPDDHIILRTSWLYSLTGKNFVKTMLTLASTRKEIGVVADQWGCPTYAPVLASAIITAIDAKRWQPGLYNLCGSGRTTWYDFARAIFREAGVECHVQPLTTDQYPTPAHRPMYSVMSTEKFCNTYNITIPEWQESLHRYFIDLHNS